MINKKKPFFLNQYLHQQIKIIEKKVRFDPPPTEAVNL